MVAYLHQLYAHQLCGKPIGTEYLKCFFRQCHTL